MNNYDVIIVGAGSTGIFTALELIEKAPKLKVCIIEKGKPLLERDRKKREDLTCGFAGSGAFSDGKLTFSTDSSYGGNLQEYTDPATFKKLLEKVDNLYMKFSPVKDIQVYGENTTEVDKIKLIAAQNGMTLLTGKLKHLGSDLNLEIMNSIGKYLLEKRVDIFCNGRVVNFEKVNDTFHLVTDASNYKFTCKYLVLAPGRSGMSWFESMMREHKVPLLNNLLDVGVRVEVPEYIGKDLDNILYEPKLVWRTPKTDMRCRTFCYNKNGFVVQESVKTEDDEIVCVNGHSNSKDGERSNNNNFAILVSSNFTEPFNEPTVYGKSIAKITNLLGSGVIVQRLKDLKQFRRSTEKRMEESNIVRTLKEATPGDISYALPYKYVYAIIESFEILDKLFKGINDGETLIYAPEIKFFSSKVDLSYCLETTTENLFAGGDGAGVSRGLVQASACGLIIGEEISRRDK